jgi:hypothetical protein
MQAIVWWTVPLLAFVLAIVWVSIANRPRPPVDPHDSVAEHERFREAMGRQTGTPTRPVRARTAEGDEPPQNRPGPPAGPA